MSWKLRAAMSALLVVPQAAWALGLGDIRLNSALNEALSAEIDLVAPTTEELGSLSAQLASRDLFQRYGLDRPAYLDSVKFTVGRGRDGRSVLLVSSSAPIVEPFVTFLVEVNWPRGRLLREYTVLLDPPVFAAAPAAPPAPVAAPRVPAPEAPQPSAARPAPRPAPEALAGASVPAAVGPGGTYQVQPGDTLFGIAARLGGSDRASANRMMIALFRANPDAFAGNINVLKAGATLRVPGPDELQSVSAAEAASEIARQMGAWQASEVSATPARLRLVAPAEASAEALPADASAGEVEARIQSLRREIGESQRLLELKNAELAELQARLARERAAEAAAAPASETAAPPAPGAAAPAAEAPAGGEPAAAVPPPAAEPTPRPAAERPVRAEAPPSKSFFDSLTDNWTYVLGAAVLLLGGGLAFGYMRRRREEDLGEALRSFEPGAGAPVPTETARLRALALGGEEEAPPRPAPSVQVEETFAPASRPPVPGAAARAEGTFSSESPLEFDQADPLAEADFHMAYGLYDQAADIVKLAQDREPGRADLKMKLLEIYFVSGNKLRFLEAARQFNAARSPAEAADWDRVVIMGRQIAPEDPLFAGRSTVADAGVDLSLEGGENRVDLELLGPPVGDEDVDLDLGQALAGVSGAAETGENESIDLDLSETESPTAEMPRADHTAEIPTVEIPSGDAPTIEATRLDLGEADTLRTKIERAGQTVAQPAIDATGELSIDDLGIDVGDFGALPEIPDEDDVTLVAHPVDDATLLAPAAGGERAAADDADRGTAALPGLKAEMDFDLDQLAEDAASTTSAIDMRGVDLDVGATLSSRDNEPSVTAQIEFDDLPGMSELEPVTMSEVGTKLDLARAYVDMGDPDGARSILEEVLKEGSVSQRQEAQRLMDGLPGA
jgi:pilus assembly protein FimV